MSGVRETADAWALRVWRGLKRFATRPVRKVRRGGVARSHALALLAIFALGLALRSLHLASVFYSPFSDMQFYQESAKGLFVQGNVERYSLFPPGFPLFLHLLSPIAGENHRVYLWANVLIDALTILLVAGIGRRLGGAKLGLVAAFVYAITDIYTLNSALLMSEPLSGFLAAASIERALALWRRPTAWRLAATGLLLAAAAHVRSNYIVYLGPFCVVLALGRLRRPFKKPDVRRLLLAGALLAFTLVLLVPWSVVVSKALKTRAILSANTGLLLLMGNNPYKDGGFMALETLPADTWEPISKAGRGEKDRLMKAAALRMIAEQPWQFATRILPAKLRAIFLRQRAWNYWPWDDGQFGNHYAMPLGPRLYFPFLPTLMVLQLGVLGFFCLDRRAMWFLGLCLMANLVPTMIVPGIIRYRFPLDFLGCFCFAALVLRVGQAISFRRLFATAWIALGLAALIGTAVNRSRFSSANLLKNEADITLKTEPLRQMVDDVYEVEMKPVPGVVEQTAPLGVIALHPWANSYALLSFDFKIDTARGEKWKTIDFGLQWRDKNNEPIEHPGAPQRLFGGWVPLNLGQKEWRRGWRVVYVPAAARSLVLAFFCSIDGKVSIRNLSLVGPSGAERD